MKWNDGWRATSEWHSYIQVRCQDQVPRPGAQRAANTLRIRRFLWRSNSLLDRPGNHHWPHRCTYSDILRPQQLTYRAPSNQIEDDKMAFGDSSVQPQGRSEWPARSHWRASFLGLPRGLFPPQIWDIVGLKKYRVTSYNIRVVFLSSTCHISERPLHPNPCGCDPLGKCNKRRHLEILRTRKSVYQEACAILYAKIQIGIRVPTLFEAEIFVEDKWFEIKKPETLVLPVIQVTEARLVNPLTSTSLTSRRGEFPH